MKNSRQFLQFAAVGVLNTAIDIGILSILIMIFGISWSPMAFPVFKSVSFAFALVNSYIWNKYWVFNHKSNSIGYEAVSFAGISALGLGLNTLTASVVFALGLQIAPEFSHVILADLSALVGTVIVLIWNFVGYKFIVFKRV